MGFLRPQYLLSVLAAGAIVATVSLSSSSNSGFSLSGQPLFPNTENFVLFAEDEIIFEQDVQVSSGDVGTNGDLTIKKEGIVSGNIYGNRIAIEKDTQINGNAAFNILDLAKGAQILGSSSSTLSLPVALTAPLPDIDHTFEGKGNVLPAGAYGTITLKKGAELTLTGETYRASNFRMEEGSTLLFSSPTTLEVGEEFTAGNKISILPAGNLSPHDLLLVSQSEKTLDMGKEAFLNLRILASNAEVKLEEGTTFRGRINAKKVRVEKGVVMSLGDTFKKDSNPDKIVTSPAGDQFLVNEFLILLTPEASLVDAQNIAASVNGRITSFVDSINLYKIEVPTNTAEELENLLTQLRNFNNPKIKVVTTNNLLEVF